MSELNAGSTVDCAPRRGMSAVEIEALVSRVLELTTLEEKVAMMSGRGFFEQYRKAKGRWGAEPYRAGAGCERLGVPALWFTDGPRGVARGQSTCFPVSMARGASWDPELEQRIGEVMGIEMRAQGCNLSGAVCINLLRHPGWGRAQETYGEDPFHVGEMGAALARGIQTHNVIATVKHFALNSMENARFKVDVEIDPRTLREVYLPHFRRVLDAGCASVMSAYNKVNGEYCGQNRALLTDILRHEWGFDGFVHSDWVLGVYQPYGAAAGLDIENPEPVHFGARLVEAVNDGTIAPDVVDGACRRILRTLYRFAAAEDPLEEYDPARVACPEHVALAREAAEKSAVLLSNDGTLPLSRPSSLAVFGRLATLRNTGDHGSSRVSAPYVVTALEGLARALGEPELALAGDEADPALAARAAADADAAVVVVGYTADDEGEYIPGDISLGQVDIDGDSAAVAADAQARPPRNPRGGDRTRLGLPEAQVELIRAVAAANPRTVVVVVAGSAVVMSEWSDQAAAVLQTFYSGMEGGNALAALLFGEVSPSG
ncbi:MAG: glycoside hydrolase family 3 C-terminal domain-containing protein, partial [Ectothiorhodospiraceae bacterium]|nr:glycoside hydrolase family 3 C-terminal domain-containing protein [Ectothiorhodospiraceae bacterium]